MKVGLVSPFGNGPNRGMAFFRDFVQAMDERGFASLWVPEHIVFFAPEDYDSRYPYTPGGASPFRRGMGVFDPLLLIAMAAQISSRLCFGTSVLILPLRPALLTAKEAMTLDHMTNGRFELGVGSGWSEEEYSAVGVPFEKRGQRFDEYIEAIRAAWRDEVAEFHGQFVDYRRVTLEPKPVTRGGPPFLIGGDSEAALRRAARLGDGWYGWWADYDLEPHLARLRSHLDAAGRGGDESFRLKLGLPFKGTPDELSRKVDEARRLGVKELVLSVPIRNGQLLADMDTWAQAAGVTPTGP